MFSLLAVTCAGKGGKGAAVLIALVASLSRISYPEGLWTLIWIIFPSLFRLKITIKFPSGHEIISLTSEFNRGESLEARISRDADQLDLILELKEKQDLGNRYAKEWLYYAEKRGPDQFHLIGS